MVKKWAKMVLYCSFNYQTSFASVALSVQEKKFNIDFQDSCYFGFPIRTISATFLSLIHLNTSNDVSSLLAFWSGEKTSR